MERAFVANGTWQRAIGSLETEPSCDAGVQRKATLRVSALAAIATLALTAGPGFRLDPSLSEAPRRVCRLHAGDRDRETGGSRACGDRDHQRLHAPRPQRNRGGEARRGACAPAWNRDHRRGDLAGGLDDCPHRRPRPAPGGADMPPPRRPVGRLPEPGGELSRAPGPQPAPSPATVPAWPRMASNSAAAGVGDTDIAEQMVRQGWAEAGDRTSPTLVMAEAQSKEAEARHLAGLNPAFTRGTFLVNQSLTMMP